MDCLICFKIFIKEKEYENISPPKSDICARSICKLLEIPNSPRIQQIFKDPAICSKCYKRLENVHEKLVQLEEIERKIEGIRGEVQKDLENSKNVSQVMKNAYGGGISKSSMDREVLIEVVEGLSKDNPQEIAKNESGEPQDASSDESIKFELSPQPETIPMRITRNRRKQSNIKEEMQIDEFQEHTNIDKISGPNEMNLEKRKTSKRKMEMKNISKITPKSSKNSKNSDKIRKREIFPSKAIPNPKKSKKDLICSECEKPHNSEAEFEAHMESALISTSIQKCSKCAEEFWGNQCLKYHFAKHHKKLDNNCGAIKFECGLCFEKFPNKWNLRRHEFRHSEQKPFHCQYCTRGFINKINLISHLGEKKAGYCEICKEDFKSNGCLRHHNSISHGLSYYSTLKSTERRDLVKCKTCNKYYTSKHLKQHELTHGEPKFKCPEIGCDKLFKRKDHMDDHIKRVHEGIKNKCKFESAGKKFCQKYLVNRHIRLIHKKSN